jgi:hypothetical protein
MTGGKHDDADVRAQRTVQQVGHVVDQLGNGHGLGIEVLPAREGQHALGEDGAPLRGLPGVGHQRRDPGIVADAPLDELQAAQHRRQQVVEIVRDAAGQLADRLHLLRLEQRFPRRVEMLLGLPPFGEVARDLGEAQQRARRAADGIDDHMRPEVRAVLAHPPAFGLELAGALGRLQRGRRNAACDVLLGIEQREVPADHFPGCIALEALGAGIPARDVAGSVEHVDRIVGDGVDQQPEALLIRERRAQLLAALVLLVSRHSRSRPLRPR